jgi:hypothetical protein
MASAAARIAANGLRSSLNSVADRAFEGDVPRQAADLRRYDSAFDDFKFGVANRLLPAVKAVMQF